jgi:hypothetical protein
VPYLLRFARLSGNRGFRTCEILASEILTGAGAVGSDQSCY